MLFVISGFDMPKLFTLYLNYFVGSVYYQNVCTCTILNVIENQMDLTWKVKSEDNLSFDPLTTDKGGDPQQNPLSLFLSYVYVRVQFESSVRSKSSSCKIYGNAHHDHRP